MSKFKIGDRVRILNLESYAATASQGLILGNTGTVMKIGAENSKVYIRTDGPEENKHSMSYGLEGWPFKAVSLERISEPMTPNNLPEGCPSEFMFGKLHYMNLHKRDMDCKEFGCVEVEIHPVGTRSRLSSPAPQVWTAETIKDAPNGDYVAHYISWGVSRPKQDWIDDMKSLRGVVFFGPLPTPPVSGVAPQSPYDKAVEALAPYLPDGWVCKDESGWIYLHRNEPKLYEDVWVSQDMDGEQSLNSVLNISKEIDWRTSLRRIQGGKVVAGKEGEP